MNGLCVSLFFFSSRRRHTRYISVLSSDVCSSDLGPTITDSDTRASAEFTRSALSGNDIVMKSAGNQLRSYCYVLDCASAILYCLLFGESDEAYNISNDKSIVSIRDMAESIAKNGKVQIKYVHPSDKERKSYNLMSNSSLTSKKLEDLGWKACFSLDDGVKATLNLLKE